MTEQIWRYHTPERDGHAPDDWDGGNVQYAESRRRFFPAWAKGVSYRYRAKPCLQDATYEPDLLAQCLALPQDQREALIEAMQKPQRDWADDVWEQAREAYFAHPPYDEAIAAGAAVIRSMCRPKEECA